MTATGWKRLVWVSVCLLAVAAVGCASSESGRKVNVADTSRIVKGQTTKGQVVQLFGEPSNRSVSAGRETWMWSYTRYESKQTPGTVAMGVIGIPGGSRSTSEMEQSSLTVVFAGDVVEDYSYSEGKQGGKSASY
jgi:hypothetical protein